MLSPLTSWLLVAIDVSVKSMLLAAVVFVLLKTFKIRNSSARHRVWAAVLCGMLTLPVLSRVVPPLPLPFSIDATWLEAFEESPKPYADAEVSANGQPKLEVEATPPVVADPSSATPVSGEIAWNEHAMQPEALHRPFGSLLPTDDSNTESETPTSVAPLQVSEIEPAIEAERVRATPAIPWDVRILRWLPISVAVVWLTGVVIMSLRLLLGLLVTRGILRRATDISADLPPSFAIQKGSGGLIRESTETRVPVTVGLLRPCILMPVEWRQWSQAKLEAVMTHEKTHVERCDFLFAALAEFNRCLYWFHPLSWWLKTELSDLAEEACDDAAIGLTGDPTGYAKHLLEVAASLSRGEGRICNPGLSMARQSNVEAAFTLFWI